MTHAEDVYRVAIDREENAEYVATLAVEELAEADARSADSSASG
jgi:hypothetical protein